MKEKTGERGEGGWIPTYLKKSSLSQKELVKTDIMGNRTVLDSHQFILLHLKVRLKKMFFVLFLNRLGT